jgi:hypothetical protein
MSTTTDPTVPHAVGPPDEEPVQQADVLSEAERALRFVRPLRLDYYHLICDTRTHMRRDIAETYARDPGFYSATFCVYCSKHRPLSEFVWVDLDGNITSEQVGT